MKRLYLDSNVVLIFILNRKDFGDAAEKLFDAAAQQQAQLFASSLTFVIAHYVTSKQVDKTVATQKLVGLFSLVSTTTIDTTSIAQALHANSPDFEDAVQLHAALAAEAIVTRDPSGFRGSPVPVLDPLAVLRQL